MFSMWAAHRHLPDVFLSCSFAAGHGKRPTTHFSLLAKPASQSVSEPSGWNAQAKKLDVAEQTTFSSTPLFSLSMPLFLLMCFLDSLFWRKNEIQEENRRKREPQKACFQLFVPWLSILFRRQCFGGRHHESLDQHDDQASLPA